MEGGIFVSPLDPPFKGNLLVFLDCAALAGETREVGEGLRLCLVYSHYLLCVIPYQRIIFCIPFGLRGSVQNQDGSRGRSTGYGPTLGRLRFRRPVNGRRVTDSPVRTSSPVRFGDSTGVLVSQFKGLRRKIPFL